MAQYTKTIGLHQWEPQDDFLRTDFNQDFAKIDAGFGWLEGAAARMGYEALQSRLAADAEGKPVPAGRGLVFDSFRTGGRVTLSGGCAMKNDGGVLLDAQGFLADIDHGFGDVYNGIAVDPESSNSYRNYDFTAAGNGTVNVLKTYLKGNTDTKAYFSILQNGVTLWQASEIAVTLDSKLYTFYPNLAVKKGVKYTIRVGAGGVGNLRFRVGKSNGDFGYYLQCSSSGGKSGTVTTAAQTVPPFGGVWAWVRHSGGTVGVSLSRNSGSYVALERGEARSCTDIRGKACTETEFRLPPGETPTGGSVRFHITIQNETDAELRDFGAALI